MSQDEVSSFIDEDHSSEDSSEDDELSAPAESQEMIPVERATEENLQDITSEFYTNK